MSAADQRLREAEVRFPVGRQVRCCGAMPFETKICSKPWMLPDGIVVVLIFMAWIPCALGVDHLEVI